MNAYFDYGDVKALIIGVIGGLLVIAIQRYWSDRSLKSLQRRIERAESQKRNLDFLWENEAYTLLRGFNFLFQWMVLVSAIVAADVALRILDPSMPKLRAIIMVFLWGVAGGSALYLRMAFGKLVNYPISSKKLEEKIARLKEVLTARTREN